MSQIGRPRPKPRLEERAKGPAACQPRAAPWVSSAATDKALKGRDHSRRPFRAGFLLSRIPRALPWAGMFAHLRCSLRANRKCMTGTRLNSRREDNHKDTKTRKPPQRRRSSAHHPFAPSPRVETDFDMHLCRGNSISWRGGGSRRRHPAHALAFHSAVCFTPRSGLLPCRPVRSSSSPQ